MLFSLPLLLAATPDTPPQPPPQSRPHGISMADADDDGRITREEMIAWLDSDFDARDQDGDGLIPVAALVRPGPPPGAASGDHPPQRLGQRGGPRGGGPGGGSGFGGGGFGGPRGGIGSGDHQRSGQHRDGQGATPSGGMEAAPMPGGMPRFEDSNDDGMIYRAEFSTAALLMFDDLDLDHDGVVTRDEMPPPPPHRAGDDEAAPRP